MVEVTISLPVLHAGQVGAYNLIDPATGKRARKKAIRCGRRWGKTDLGKVIACDGALKSEIIGWFAPDYKRELEAYNEVLKTLDPLRDAGTSKTDGVIRVRYGGHIDFWTLEDVHAGRSRRYHKVIIDEAAFTKPMMMEIWEKSIEPTLLDYSGSVTVLSNTNGIDSTNFFWKICNEPKYGFIEYHAPAMQNPHVPIRTPGESYEDWQARRDYEFEQIRLRTPPLVYQQEYLAEFVDWSGVAFFSLDKLTLGRAYVDPPGVCDCVFATIDTATKTGKEHDGTAVCFWALNKRIPHRWPLTLLDWDIVQIEGDLLVNWLPSVYQRLEHYARLTRARAGSIGALIEDKNSGSILIRQAQRLGMQVQAIDSKLTSLGKDERAISVSGYVYTDQVKFAAPADKLSIYKEVSRNHLEGQVIGYRVGIKDPNAQDDLLDTFCYGIAMGLGNYLGF